MPASRAARQRITRICRPVVVREEIAVIRPDDDRSLSRLNDYASISTAAVVIDSAEPGALPGRRYDVDAPIGRRIDELNLHPAARWVGDVGHGRSPIAATKGHKGRERSPHSVQVITRPGHSQGGDHA